MSVSHNRHDVAAPASVVFDVVSDPTTYPDWLVGAQAITDVDPTWPREGASFSHRIGVGPLRTPGSTTVRRLVPGRSLDLGAGMGPLGEASVHIEVVPDGAGSVVVIEERPRRGLARLVHKATGPLVAWALWGRNAVSLSSLAELAEQRHHAAR